VSTLVDYMLPIPTCGDFKRDAPSQKSFLLNV